MEHFDELELIGFDEGNVVEARVGFDSKVVVHKEDEGVDFNMQVVGGGIGFKEEGWWEVGVGSWWRSSWKTKGGPSSWAGWRPIGRGRGRRSQASGRGGRGAGRGWWVTKVEDESAKEENSQYLIFFYFN